MAAPIPGPIESDPRWTAVQQRDRQADGTFVYGVRTTGIFCRPSCASRQPRRENVRLFADPMAARRAGFRPCKRCRPESDPEPGVAAVERACRHIEALSRPPSMAELALAVGLSPSHLHRLFRRILGTTPAAYADTLRQNRLRTHLAQGANVTAAIRQVGFGSTGRYYDGTDRGLGMTPATFRRGARGEMIDFALSKCSLGWLAVAVTQRGVCLIEIGDDREHVAEAVRRAFPRAEVREQDPNQAEWLTAVVRLVEKPGPAPDLPLDIRGTAFQRRVWEELRTIPPGATLSYLDLACRIGQPSATRAVAGACAANRLAVAIPCHRVVRSDGSLSGYRWGPERKQALLEREAKGIPHSEE